MRVLQVHCTYQYAGGEDSVVVSERNLLRENGVVVEELAFNNVGGVLKKVIQTPFNLQSYQLTRKKIKAFRPDVIHIHNLHFAASPSVIFAIQKSGVPYIQTLHNYRLICPSALLFHDGKLFLDSIHQKFPWAAIRAGVYRNSKPLTAWIALSTKIHQWMGTWKKASRYIVLSRHAENTFLSAKIGITANQLTVKPNFSTSRYLPSVASSDHFVFIGRLSEEKGISVLLKAFSTLPFKIRIAGDGPMKEEVIAYSTKFSNIEFVGNLSREEVFPFLAGGIALVFPSTWYEGMPMVIIEAFACGLPVIASRMGAMAEMIVPGHNGIHFEAGQVEDLQTALKEFANLSDAQRKAYRENAYSTYIDLYTPEKNAELLLGIYKDVINASPVPIHLRSAFSTV